MYWYLRNIPRLTSARVGSHIVTLSITIRLGYINICGISPVSFPLLYIGYKRVHTIQIYLLDAPILKHQLSSNKQTRTRRRQESYTFLKASSATSRTNEQRASEAPSHEPTISFAIYPIPSVPMTNPTKFADNIMRMLNTAPMAHTCLYHQYRPYCVKNVSFGLLIRENTYFGGGKEVCG